MSLVKYGILGLINGLLLAELGIGAGKFGYYLYGFLLLESYLRIGGVDDCLIKP